MPWTKKTFQNKPSTATPLTAAELNNLGDQYAAARADAVADVEAAIGDTETEVGAALANTIVASGNERHQPAFSAHRYIPRDAFGQMTIDPATTDVTTYVQQVIDEAGASGIESTVYFPAGTTRCEPALASSVRLLGSSHGRSSIRAVPGSTRKGVVTMSQVGGPVTRVAIENIAIVGDPTNTSQWGIYAKTPPRPIPSFDHGLWYSTLRNVRITNTLGGGIWLVGGGEDSLGPVQFLNWDNVSVQVTSGTAPNWDGILLSGQIGQCSFDQVESSYRGTGYGHRALHIAREMDENKANLSDRWGYALKFDGCTFQGASVAIQIDRAQGVEFDACWIEDNQSGFLAQHSAKGVVFSACTFADTGSNGLGTGYVGQVLDTAVVVLIAPSTVGTIDRLWVQDAATACCIIVIGSTDNATRPLVGYPKSMAATGNMVIGPNSYVGITGSTEINTISSQLDNGSIVSVRALSTLNIVGTGGNIRFANGVPSAARSYPAGSVLTFVFDKGANIMRLVRHTGPNQEAGSLEVVGTAGAGYVTHAVQSATPAAPSAGSRTFARVNGSGKTEHCVIFPTGGVIVLATEA